MNRAIGLGLGWVLSVWGVASCGSDPDAPSVPGSAGSHSHTGGAPASGSGGMQAAGTASGASNVSDKGGNAGGGASTMSSEGGSGGDNVGSPAGGNKGGSGGNKGGSGGNSGGSSPAAGKVGSEGGSGGDNDGSPAAGHGGSESGSGGGPGPACELAANWKIVDDYLAAEGVSTNVYGIAAGQSEDVYAIGLSHADAGDLVGAVRVSTNGGEDWANAAGWDGALLPSGVAVAEDGALLVTGGVTTGKVYRSVTKGANLDAVLDIPTTPEQGGPPATCNTGFVATGPGNVAVAGGSCDDDGWTIHKSKDGGKTWSQAFTFLLSPGKASRLHAVGVGPDGKAYASGYGTDADNQIHWLVVREGKPGGVISDDFQLAAGKAARAFGFASRGQLVVAGAATGTDSATYGVVRRMTGADQWETLDSFVRRANDVEQNGTALVVSGQLEAPAPVRVVTRRSVDGGVSWSGSQEYVYSVGRETFASGLTVDGAGNFYDILVARDANAVSHWVVRKLDCE